MVHAHAGNRHFERPDPTSIGAMSGAIVVHLIGVALLMIPISMPTAPPRVEKPVLEVYFRPIEEIKPIPPVPDAPTIPKRPQPVAQPQPQPTPDTRPTFTEAARPEVFVPPAPIDVQPADPGVQEGPAEVGELATIHAPHPRYPIRPLRAGIEGTVTLRILVGADGLPIAVEIGRGSGNRELDSEARRHVLKHWRFQPAMREGVAVQAWGTVDIAFRVQSG
jgi:protein TonB